MKLIVGLGNPGPKYDGTRHNVGYDVVDVLAARARIDMGGERFHGWFGLGEVSGEKVALLKPTTFMNRSGQAVLAAGRFYKLELADVLLVLDDLALPVGRIRLRASGSAGSHNGLGDILTRVGSEAIARLRIGIGEAVGVPANYVLSRFDPREEETVQRVVECSADCAECWVSQGIDVAMTKYNGAVD